METRKIKEEFFAEIYKLNMRIVQLAFLLIGILTIQAFGATGYDVEIEPPNPTTGDMIYVTLSGIWGDSCAPDEISAEIQGTNIFVKAIDDTPLDAQCATMITYWELTINLGKLGAGTYSIFTKIESLRVPLWDWEYYGDIEVESRIITVDDDGPADFNNIQDAIDDSNDGDVIIVADGIYTGTGNKNLDFGGRAITVRSENGPEFTIIDCEDSGRGFCFQSGEGPDSIILGMTITNGRSFTGGGVYCRDSSPTIHNNIISGNFAPWDGVEIPGFGGGIYCYNSSAVITDNEIIYNSVEGRGGGIFASGSSLLLSNNLIAANDAFAILGFFPSPGDGGGISCTACSIMMTNNTITSNCAHDLIFLFEYPGVGGGIYCSISTLILANDILWSNSPDEINNRESNITITYCDIEGGWPGEGNIDTDPLFADAGANDFHLKSEAGRWDANSQSWVTDANTSECIDAGDPNSDWTAELWPHGGQKNMGAYGGTPQASMSLSDVGNIADLDNDGDVDYNDLKLFTDQWPVEQALLAEDLDRNGKVDFKDYAIFGNEWFNEYIGEAGIEYQITACGVIPLAMNESGGNRFTVTVEGNYIHFEDTMVANCCATELWLEMYADEDEIIIYEKWFADFPCTCICDNPVEPCVLYSSAVV